MNLNFFFVEQTPIPSSWDTDIAREIIRLSARLSCEDNRFEDLAHGINVECGTLSMGERIELMAKLDALVAHHYGLTREEYEYILKTFEAFSEDNSPQDLKEMEWNDIMIRK